MYYGAVQALAQRVLHYIRRHQLLQAGDRVGIAVSGGVDSVALLRLLLELRPELGAILSVVHFNHKLRGPDADADQQFVAQLANTHGVEFYCDSRDVPAHAAKNHLSLEAAARALRYDYFRRLLAGNSLNRVATAHTLDDQAETVLLRLVRGAGTRGLAGIYPKLSAAADESTQQSAARIQSDRCIVRPLLTVRRKELQTYLVEIGQEWREDKSNFDLRHARNRVRHAILPQLTRELNPSVYETLAESADIARAEERYWQAEVRRVLADIWDAGSRSLNCTNLDKSPLALQRRLVRAVGEQLGLQLEFRHVEDVLAVATGEERSAALPGGWTVCRNRSALRFEPADSTASDSELDYEYHLAVPGRTEVPETRSLFEAVVISGGAHRLFDPQRSFDPALLRKTLLIRNWRPGDRFWPAHTKAPKKIKELLQEQHVTGPERKRWPVVLNETDVIWVRGFPSPKHLRPSPASKEALVIQETTLKT